MRKIGKWLLVGVSLGILAECQKTADNPNDEKKYVYSCDASHKCSASFMGPFDTSFQVIMYAKDEQQFVDSLAYIEERFTYYNALFDKYNDYENINNVKTINDHAGIQPVKVDDALIQMIETAISDQATYSKKVNIALGPVLEVWHNYREKNDGSIPTQDELEAKRQFVNLDKVVIDKQAKTVYLQDQGMSLDVGATAKGYACELVKQELVSQGVDNFLISAGGNVIVQGKRLVKAGASELSQHLPACRDYFTIDIQSPGNGAYEDVKATVAIVLKEGAAVTSGDYQRYFVGNDGVSYHHLVDPDTLTPTHYFRSVTIFAKDSGLADFLSSATFLTPLEEGVEMIENIEGVEAVWLLNDGTIKHTSGLVEGENCHFYVEVTE